MDTHAIYQGVILTVVGMLVVFIFMCLLIVLLKLFLAFAFRFLADKDTDDGNASNVTSAQQTDQGNEKVAAAIATAIKSGS